MWDCLDAMKAVEILSGQEIIDGSRIYVAGHSLGGEALPRIHNTLKKQEDVAGTYGGKENWTFKTYEGMTHLFMEEKKVNGPSDYQKKQTVDQQVITDIAAFILENE